MRRKVLHEPWRTFFEVLDQELSSSCDLHCFGGFVLTEHYGVTRSTIDVDVVDVRGVEVAEIARRAGRDSPLHRRHRAYIDVVTVADVPDDYEARLVDMHVEGLAHVRLLAFERHDPVLAKLARNTDRDREDVVALARGPGLDGLSPSPDQTALQAHPGTPASAAGRRVPRFETPGRDRRPSSRAPGRFESRTGPASPPRAWMP